MKRKASFFGMLSPAAVEAPPDPSRVFSVGELTHRIKQLLESSIPEAWIRGEVSNFRRQASGHLYFTLKDAESQLPCVMFRADAQRCSLALREGLQLLAWGSLSVYEPRGAYQLVVRAVLEDGVGRLREAFDKLKARLEAEGLFDPARKRDIPVRPRVVGFVTSPTGAAVRDFISILRRRGWRGRLVIIPAKVQGREAAHEMAAQLAAASKLNLFDLIVIGRGGGSLEDLWAFNEEPLVRAVAACPVPVISAVGHETDFTLCDFAADRRAETPSAAAELISSAFVEQSSYLTASALALQNYSEELLERQSARLELAAQRWSTATPRHFVEQAGLRIDDLAGSIQYAMRHTLHARRIALHRCSSALLTRSPATRLGVARAQWQSTRLHFARLVASTPLTRGKGLANLARRLEEAGVARVLARGFVMLSDTDGRPISRRTQLVSGQRVRARFSDGEAGLVAD